MCDVHIFNGNQMVTMIVLVSGALRRIILFDMHDGHTCFCSFGQLSLHEIMELNRYSSIMYLRCIYKMCLCCFARRSKPEGVPGLVEGSLYLVHPLYLRLCKPLLTGFCQTLHWNGACRVIYLYMVGRIFLYGVRFDIVYSESAHGNITNLEKKSFRRFQKKISIFCKQRWRSMKQHCVVYYMHISIK